MSKHTPGPWLHRGKNEGVYTAPPDGTKYTYGALIFRFQEDENESPNSADLALILAAPDLLAALRGLDEAYCRAGPHLSRDERAEDRKRLIAARTAIAKATGGAP